MRKSIVLFVAVLVALCAVIGCGTRQEPPDSPAQAVLQGEHKLRKMMGQTEVNSSLSGGFFLFVGDVKAKTSTAVSVKFAWEMNDGTYAISSLPLEKIRVKINEEAKTPTVKFRWRLWCRRNMPQPQELMDENVLYALVTVREKDWPVQVQMPLNER
jgi:hypothetical protein